MCATGLTRYRLWILFVSRWFLFFSSFKLQPHTQNNITLLVYFDCLSHPNQKGMHGIFRWLVWGQDWTDKMNDRTNEPTSSFDRNTIQIMFCLYTCRISIDILYMHVCVCMYVYYISKCRARSTRLAMLSCFLKLYRKIAFTWENEQREYEIVGIPEN